MRGVDAVRSGRSGCIFNLSMVACPRASVGDGFAIINKSDKSVDGSELFARSITNSPSMPFRHITSVYLSLKFGPMAETTAATSSFVDAEEMFPMMSACSQAKAARPAMPIDGAEVTEKKGQKISTIIRGSCCQAGKGVCWHVQASMQISRQQPLTERTSE